jgi:hypothetical protein
MSLVDVPVEASPEKKSVSRMIAPKSAMEAAAMTRSEPSDAKGPPAQAVDVHLQAGQEEQEGQAHHRQDVHGEVDLNPAEPGGPDHDPGDDLEHDRG